jgi:hypothetical protein
MSKGRIRMLKRERQEQLLVEVVGFLTLAAGAMAIITLFNWAMIARYGV